MEMAIQILLLGLGFVMLVKGADWFVEGASEIAARLGIPQLVIGLTIVAMGTSAPEASVSIAAALKGNAGITIGNIVGSNILNILIILGISAVIIPIAVAKSTIRYEIPYMIGITVVLGIFGYTGNSISRPEGIIFWILFLAYLGYLFLMAKRDGKKEVKEEVTENKKIPVMLATLVAGLVLVVWGSNITVDAATILAKTIGISERFIGLTIVALGTSLPELFTSVSAARKGKADIAIGNIVGSNIFNILFVVGTAALIIPVQFADKFVFDTCVAVLSAVILLLCTFRKQKLGRTAGIAMLAGYGMYFIYLLY